MAMQGINSATLSDDIQNEDCERGDGWPNEIVGKYKIGVGKHPMNDPKEIIWYGR